MRRIRRVAISAFACLGIVLAGCSLENGINIDKSNDQLPETQEIVLLESLDATNLHYIEPYDENTAYIVASKKFEKTPEREMVYAVCSLDTGETNVLYRETISKDGAENIDVYASSDNEIKLFTGQQLLTLNGQDVVDIQTIINDEQGVSMNLEKGAMAYISQLPPSVFYKSVNDNNEKEIVKSEELEIDGETVTLYPYIVRLKESGDKLLYGTAIETAGLYQTIGICSTDGTLLAETEQLDINSDYLDILWCGDDFITIETTDSYTQSPTGFATILTRYNEKAEEIDRIILHGIAENYQREIFSGSSLFALTYRTDSSNGLILWNTSTGDVYYICDEDEYILSPTVTPNGSKLLWFHNGSLCVKTINLDDYEKVPTY